jgi:hypothetical protein
MSILMTRGVLMMTHLTISGRRGGEIRGCGGNDRLWLFLLPPAARRSNCNVRYLPHLRTSNVADKDMGYFSI